MIDSSMASGAARFFSIMKHFLLFLQISFVFGAEYVPVLIWETHRSSAKDVTHFSPLSKLSSDEFSDYITRKVAGKASTKPTIAAFVEENLSIEDFSSQNGEESNTFPYLENMTSAASHSEFLPSVHSPLKGLKRLGYRWQNYQDDDENDVSLPDTGGVVLVVKLGDAKTDESRPNFLKRHDQIISEIFADIQTKFKDVIAVYTSRHSSWIEPDYESVERRRRSLLATDGDSDNPVNYANWSSSSALIYALATPVLTIEDKEYNLTMSKCTQDPSMPENELKVRCRMHQPFFVEFKFIMDGTGYWNVSIVVEEEKKQDIILFSPVDLYAPRGFSYHCTQDVKFSIPNDTSTYLTFQKFQIQPFVNGTVFGDAYDCVWFFTVPIWAGLGVTALLGLILMWGLAMIMDIKTMDQFDDPKGKPLTINVSE